MSRAAGRDTPSVIWGGLLPSGSLKILTFARYLETLRASPPSRGLIEISGGCTALALAHLADEASLPLIIVCTAEGEHHLRSHGFRGATFVATSMSMALEHCETREREGWHWPRQMTNPVLVSCVASWAPELVRLLRSAPELDTVVTGFGTGATLLGLHQVLGPLGYRVIGLEAPPGIAIQGWRNYAQQNLGERDLFQPHRDQVELRTARLGNDDRPPVPIEVLLSRDWGMDPARLCIVSHDAVPPPSAGPLVDAFG